MKHYYNSSVVVAIYTNHYIHLCINHYKHFISRSSYGLTTFDIMHIL